MRLPHIQPWFARIQYTLKSTDDLPLETNIERVHHSAQVIFRVSFTYLTSKWPSLARETSQLFLQHQMFANSLASSLAVLLPLATTTFSSSIPTGIEDGRRDLFASSAIDAFVASESVVALQGVLANIGPSGDVSQFILSDLPLPDIKL
jgi:hypothetical protein